MKNLITFLLYCLSVTALIAQANSESQLTVLQAGLTETTLRLDLSGYDYTDVQTPQGAAQVIHFQNGTPLLEKGAPDLPKFSTALLIPNKGNMAVEIVGGEYDEYPNVAVAPSKGNLLRTVDPATVPYEYGSEYSRDAYFPGRLADLNDPYIFRQVRGQALWIYPVQYNPVTRHLRVYRTLTLRVYATGGAGKNELSGGPLLPESRAFSQLYRRLFANYTFDAAARGGGLQDPDKMLVITADALLDELQPLVTWKRQMGIHTTVVPMSEIGSTKSSDVYNFVKSYYAQHGITYLLLVGDEYAIEPEMRPSGALYSCDNCFGYMSGDDHFPEVLVGRLHASTPEQLRIMVNRNLEYEINPLIDSAQNWLATGMASASNEGDGIGDDGQADWQHANEWKINHLADGFEKYWEFYDGNHSADSPTPGDATADQPGNPTNTPLVNLMNSRGVSLYNYTGHGWEQGLVSGNFNTDAVGQLRNKSRYPILIAVACCAGNFTNGECLGEAWQRAGDPATGEPWGGIAGFFSSDYQSWSPPMEGQDGMNQYLTDADGLQLTPSIGGMLAYGNARMIAAYNQGGELMADFWNPFAEPSTMPRTATPKALAAIHVDSTAFETTSILVSCPVEGALVSLFWENQTWAVATVENGVAELFIAPLNNIGNLVVTVTQFNYLPYQGTIAVKPAAQPFVVGQNIQLDDSAGNNNQRADYGEAVSLNVFLKNIGLGTATGVEARISTNSPYLTVTNNLATVGDINSNTGLPVNFGFTVGAAIPNGAKAEILLTLKYSDTIEYSVPVPLNLYAPVLEIGAWTIDDSQQGNGNKRLDSGEIVRIHIINRNTGGSDCPKSLGTLTSLSPYLTVNGTALIGPLNAATGEESIFFLVTVSPSAPPSVSANLNYLLRTPDGSYQAEKNIGPLTVNAIIETFESNNFNTFNWQQLGQKPWLITTAAPYAGQYCARSGTITHNQESTMELQMLVLEPGTVAFARRVSSEADFDFLRFYIDGVEMGAWSGNVPWGEVSYPVETGLHTLTWTYQKDDLVSSGTDRAWVDEITLPPHQIVVGTHTPGAETLRMAISPNPNSGTFDLQLQLPEAQALRIDLYDGLGRLVRPLQAPVDLPAGLFRTRVDLGAVRPGVYLVQASGAGVHAVKKVVITR